MRACACRHMWHSMQGQHPALDCPVTLQTWIFWLRLVNQWSLSKVGCVFGMVTRGATRQHDSRRHMCRAEPHALPVVPVSMCRERVAAALGVPADDLELSMGMSGDYEQAVSAAAAAAVADFVQLMRGLCPGTPLALRVTS